MKIGKRLSKAAYAWWRRLLVLCTDVIIITVAFLFSCIAFAPILQYDLEVWWLQWLLITGCCGLFLLLLRCYDSLWRYATSQEYLRQMVAMAGGYVLYFIIDRILIPRPYHYSCRMMGFVVLVSLVAMWIGRFSYRILKQMMSGYLKQRRNESKPLVIVGAGNAGVSLLEELRSNAAATYYVYGFFDDDLGKRQRRISGVKVLGTVDEIVDRLKGTDVKDIIVAIPSISAEGQKRILNICAQTECRIRLLPRLAERMQSTDDQQSMYSHIREVKPEDLLGREAITFDNQEVYDFLQDKVVLVTGGGGSIGSELCRQIAVHRPKTLIVLDIYENNAYDIQQELRYIYKDALDLRIEIASVRDRDKIDYLFRKYRPQIVFHAAAHKHVPLMEDCPEEAIKNNVFGTYNVAEIANLYEAEKFILISTDKAVNPTNVMGASKRMCEMVIQSMQERGTTKYVAVRFGNVLGSNGSVIPLFKRQLEQGGPITVTDRRIIRYFMTIPEAAQLVMQAGAMADSSQIFVLDMGEPVKILTLAENLVRMAGYVPYKDIDIVEVGLRPGEKLYEELLMKNDCLSATKYNKIFVEQRESIPYDRMQTAIGRLRTALEAEDPEQLVALMRQIVPTFRTPEEVNRERIREQQTAEETAEQTTNV